MEIKPGTIIKTPKSFYYGKNRTKYPDGLLVVAYVGGHVAGKFYGVHRYDSGDVPAPVLSRDEFEVIDNSAVDLYETDKSSFLEHFKNVELLHRM